MEVTLTCPNCQSALPLKALNAPNEVHCGACQHLITILISENLENDCLVDQCPQCEGTDFYRRKDFDPQIGLLVVVMASLISAVFLWYELVVIAFGVLGAAALIDLIVYQLLGEITVCYRCHSEFRGTYDVQAGNFDLHTADELELEWSQELERRQKILKKNSDSQNSETPVSSDMISQN